MGSAIAQVAMQSKQKSDAAAQAAMANAVNNANSAMPINGPMTVAPSVAQQQPKQAELKPAAGSTPTAMQGLQALQAMAMPQTAITNNAEAIGNAAGKLAAYRPTSITGAVGDARNLINSGTQGLSNLFSSFLAK